MTSPVESESAQLKRYIDELTHSWSRTLTALGFTLYPLFFVLDVFMMPKELLPRFAIYRLAATVLIVAQFISLKFTRPNGRSWMNGYIFSLSAGSMIALMTTDLEGFNSTYYAGLNLVLIATNLLLPWAAIHSAINSAIIIGLYVVLNLLIPNEEPFKREILINNLYFLVSTSVIAVSINYVKQKLITQEFHLRSDLKSARDALWGEMEVAKRIQTSLLPTTHEVSGYRIAATMLPATEVGGDYYDVIETPHGQNWLCIGDVSGHGVESGLIMMMTQTSIATVVNRSKGVGPAEVLSSVNAVLKTNISRLGVDRYITALAVELKKDQIVFAGKHQDVLIYRAKSGKIDKATTDGVWLGVVDDISSYLVDETRPIEEDDVLLLYTDGITEAMNEKRELFGEDRLRQVLMTTAQRNPEDIVQAVVKEVLSFMHEQKDDLSVVVARRSREPRATA